LEQTKLKLAQEVRELYDDGVQLLLAEVDPEQAAIRKGKVSSDEPPKKVVFVVDYQAWYSKALSVVRQLLPDRYAEFQEYYRLDKRKEISFLTYTISDYLLGLRVTRGYEKKPVVDTLSALSSKFQLQLTVLLSAVDRIDSVLADIEGVIRSDMFVHEIEAAGDLLKKGYLRAAGTLAGVCLESHLAHVAKNRGLKLTKKSPTLSDLNEALKAAGMIDIPTWRHLQRLGDIRNLCAHAKEREPTKDEVSDLVSGTRKMTSELF
jgi:hypothetical protein